MKRIILASNSTSPAVAVSPSEGVVNSDWIKVRSNSQYRGGSDYQHELSGSGTGTGAAESPGCGRSGRERNGEGFFTGDWRRYDCGVRGKDSGKTWR